jgi:hypothetical protein
MQNNGSVRECWIPLQYLRADPSKFEKGEFRLPIHYAWPQITLPHIGMDYATAFGEVAGAEDLESLKEYARYSRENRKDQCDRLRTDRKIIAVENGVHIELLDGPESLGKKGPVAWQILILEGVHKDKRFWVSQSQLTDWRDDKNAPGCGSRVVFQKQKR